MNSKISTPILFWLLMIAFGSLGQTYDFVPKDQLISSRNNFYNFYFQNPDSALIYARQVAADPAHTLFLREALHRDFFAIFHKKVKQQHREQAIQMKLPINEWEDGFDTMLDICYQTLVKLEADPNQLLSSSARPMLYWVNVQRNAQDNQKLEKLIDEFITTELSQDDLYFNGAGLYALLMYQEISDNKELGDVAQNLLLATISKLGTLQDNESITTASWSMLHRRAWYRYIYSSANHLMATRLLEGGQKTEAASYQKAAFDFSPDLTDKLFSSVYFIEGHFLNDNKAEPFYAGHLNSLKTNDNNKEKLLDAYTALALKDPKAYKGQLKSYYTEHFSERESFQEFWNKQVNINLTMAPAIDLQRIDGGSFNSSASQGKWILIDFWGTWCGPCREEHPMLQKFYESIASEYSDKIDLYTIACHDTEDKVSAYMAQFKYSFPVALTDTTIGKAFNVLGYPTKVLITPEGKYLTIPSIGFDWVEFVKEYASL